VQVAEADALVEGLGAIDIGDWDRHELEPHLWYGWQVCIGHGRPPFSRRCDVRLVFAVTFSSAAQRRPANGTFVEVRLVREAERCLPSL